MRNYIRFLCIEKKKKKKNAIGSATVSLTTMYYKHEVLDASGEETTTNNEYRRPYNRVIRLNSYFRKNEKKSRFQSNKHSADFHSLRAPLNPSPIHIQKHQSQHLQHPPNTTLSINTLPSFKKYFPKYLTFCLVN
jgi:hypothetical protein